MLRLRFIPLLLVTLAALGCGSRYSFEDDLETPDFELNIDPFSSPSDDLRTPYATGTRIGLYVQGAEGECDGMEVSSSDPAVLRIDSFSDGCWASATAVAPGRALLSVWEGGDREHDAAVEVLTPDRVELHARGPLLHGLPASQTLTPRPRVLSEFAATFRVRYFAGERVVTGQGLLSATALDLTTVATEETEWSDKAEWIQILPHGPGVHRVQLLAGEADLGTLEVDAVEPSAIVSVDLRASEEDEEGQGGQVLALAMDAEGRPIYGAPFDWSLDGRPVEGTGDLFDYAYDPASEATLEASSAGRRTSTLVHAISGSVHSSAVVDGCSTVPGAPGAPWLMLGLGLPAVMLAARRRPR